MTGNIHRLDKVAPRRGANLLLEILKSEGVEYIFGNPGTTELPLIDALLETPQIRYILALQEASAVAMADGYAQAARKPGFINLHTAGGMVVISPVPEDVATGIEQRIFGKQTGAGTAT